MQWGIGGMARLLAGGAGSSGEQAPGARAEGGMEAGVAGKGMDVTEGTEAGGCGRGSAGAEGGGSFPAAAAVVVGAPGAG